METFALLELGDTNDVFSFGRSERPHQDATSLRFPIAKSARHQTGHASNLIISFVVLAFVAFSAEKSSAANEDRLFQCDFELLDAAVFTRDGRWLLGFGTQKLNKKESSGMVCVWDLESRRVLQKLSLYNVSTADVALSNDGRWVGTFGSDSVGHLWNIQSQSTRKDNPLSLARTFRHYEVPPKTVIAGGRYSQMIMAPSSLEFATVGSTWGSRYRPDNKFSIKVWPMLGTISTSRTNPGSPANSNSTSSSLSKSTGSSASVTAPSDTEVQSGNQPRLTIPIEDWPTDITYSPDGKLLVIGFWTGPRVDKPIPQEVHFFDSDTGSLKDKWTFPGTSTMPHYGFDGSLVFSPDGSHLLICLAGRETAELRRVESEQVIWRGHSRTGFRSGAFSPDGKLLALSSNDYEVQLLRFPECEVISVGVTPESGTTITFSPDGKWLATHWKSNSYKLWNVEELLAQKRWWLDKKPSRRNAEITQPK